MLSSFLRRKNIKSLAPDKIESFDKTFSKVFALKPRRLADARKRWNSVFAWGNSALCGEWQWTPPLDPASF